MRNARILLLCLLLLAGFNALGQSPWSWQKLSRGAEYTTVRMELDGRMQCISALRYKPCRFRTDIVDAQCSLADSTSALAEKAGAFAAINGSYFNMRTLEDVSFVKDEGRIVGATTAREMFRTDGVLALKGRRVRIFAADTASYLGLTRRYRDAIAAGPLLLKGGKPLREEWPAEGFFTKRHPRSVIGLDAKGWVYLIVIDGRFPDQAVGTTIPETIQVARVFGLQDALNLDGGGSSVLWIKEAGAVSHPCDNHSFDHYGQRIVPNIVVVR